MSHLPDQIQDDGVPQLLILGLHKKWHKVDKSLYAKISKTKRCFMNNIAELHYLENGPDLKK